MPDVAASSRQPETSGVFGSAMSVVRTALAQVAWTGERASMTDRLEESVREAARRGVRLLAFPELCTSPYFCATRGNSCDDYFEPIPEGATIRRMSALAGEHRMVIVVPLAERDVQGKRYNSAAVLDADGTLAGTCRKRHLPHAEGSWEQDYFRPGDDRPAVFATAAGRIGLAICWDRFFPDTWQHLARDRAQITIAPIASALGPSHRRATLVQPAMAMLHGMFVATVNRTDDGHFAGGSYVADPSGDILGPFGPEHETLVVRQLDLDRTTTADGAPARCRTGSDGAGAD